MKNLSPGTLLLGVFAVLFGLVGAYAVKQHLRKKPEPVVVEEDNRLSVPLASTDLAAGRTLTLGDIVLMHLTPEQCKKRGIPNGFMTNPRQVIGRTLREPLKQGEAFFTTSLYSEGTGPNVASRLKPGFRAVSIHLESRAAKSSLVTPGAIVDVLFRTFAERDPHVPETTLTLLERVEVLAIGQEALLGARMPSNRSHQAYLPTTVTLAVTPEQVKALAVVEGKGMMSLALRGTDDEGVSGSASPETLASLLGLEEPKAPFTTDIYRRGQLSTTVFGKGKRASLHPNRQGMPLGMTEPPNCDEPTLAAVQASPEEPCGCGDSH